MVPINLGYSVKNIPPCNCYQYTVKMYETASKLIERMRWKAHFSNAEEQETDQTEFKGIFPTEKSAPKDKHLTRFENELYDLIKNIKFRKFSNSLVNKMKKDLSEIESSKKVFIFADKSTNMYKMDPSEYRKLLNENVTTTYKKAKRGMVDKINEEAGCIVENCNIPGKVPKLQEQPAFITLKDHKADFPNKVSCRLLNPSKTHIAKVAKRILDRLIKSIRSRSELNQWKNTDEVLKWFNKINQKDKHRFIKFDIVNFYPSISKKTLELALEYAKDFDTVTREDIDIIMHCCKSVLIHEGVAWSKKDDSSNFDIPMGSYHGAEVCELVGLFLLNEIRNGGIFENDKFGIYRDDGLAIVKATSGSILERISKKLRKICDKYKLKITIDSNLFKTEFLDVILDLKNDCYGPYRKPNSEALYVHSKSNHPKYVIKHIPQSINGRLQRISKNATAFQGAREYYQDALKKGGHQHVLSYQPENEKKKNKKRKRKNIIFFNPPYCKSVETRIGKCFLDLVDRNFGNKHPYHKIFNRKLLKISYSCMPNIKSRIMAHNRKMLDDDPNMRMCNCRVKNECPVSNRCLTENTVYKATVFNITKNETNFYIGSTGLTFKNRYTKHKHSFNWIAKRNATALSDHIWKLKENNNKYKITWEILARTKIKYNSQNGCKLCNMEKAEIAKLDSRGLNKRDELQSGCPHYKNMFL